MINMGRRNSKLRRYARIEKSIEAEVFAQMNKPREQRDNAYIHESLETLSYVREAAQRLEAFHEVEAISYSVSRVRRLAIAATLTVAVLVSVGGIAEALGVRVWNAIIKRDLNFFQISYFPSESMPQETPNGQEVGDNDNISGKRYRFTSLKEASETLEINPPLPSYIPTGMELKFPVKGYESSLQRWIELEYQADGHYLSFRVSLASKGVSGIVLPQYDEYEAYWSGGFEHHIILSGAEYMVIWHSNEYRIMMKTDLDVKQVKLVLDSLYKTA